MSTIYTRCPRCGGLLRRDENSGVERCTRCPYRTYRESRNPQPWREDATTMDAQRSQRVRRRMRRP